MLPFRAIPQMQIYIHRDGQDHGPFSLEQANQMLAAGELLPADQAWHEGLAEWTRLDAIAGIDLAPPMRSRKGVLAGVVATIVVGGLVAAVLMRGGNSEPSPTAEPGAKPVVVAASFDASAVASKTSFDYAKIAGFLESHCFDCHDADMKKGGLDLAALSRDLDDAAAMAKWVRIHDRVQAGEMPPKQKPAEADKTKFLSELGASLTGAHAKSKGTVLRRLNRVEYANTVNDLFGTQLDLASMLPEDGRSHEFDNVGEALSVSPVQLQTLLDAIDTVMDTAIVNSIHQPESKVIKASYLESRDSSKFVGRVWGKTADNAVVFFKRSGYPSGMLRGSSVREPGFYKVRVTGYAYQSQEPITFSIGATTFQRGADKPTFGYYSLPPGKPTTVEIEAFLKDRYMIQIEPFGIFDRNNKIGKAKDAAFNYQGPGLAINHVEIEGPLVKEYPSRGHKLIFDGVNRKEMMPRNPRDRQKKYYRPKFTIETTDPVGDATKALKRVATKAFRRPVSDEKLAPYVKLFESETGKGSSFEEALRTAIAAVFCSPDFLYFQEKPGRLDDFALASRLSYFLTRTAPDEPLLAAAAAGRLTGDPKALQQQTDRLLDHAKSEQFITDFTDAWLDLRSIDFTNPDRKLFPEFDDFLKFSILAETRAFFRELLAENLSLANFIDSDFAMLNSRLAEHYEVPGVRGPALQKVALPPDSPRGGIMAQGSILKVSANGTTTSPVLRGVWTLERIFGITPPPPPPSIPGVEPDIRGAETIRQLLDKHRSMTSCQGCHQMIDPPGFALESFNPIGGYRERFRSIGKGERVNKEIDGRRVNYKLGPPVDASGQLNDGRQFKDFNEFKQLLLASKDQVAKCVTKKLLTFATGREMGFSDRPEIEHIVQELDRNGDGLRTLVHLVVQSKIFRNK